MAYLGIGPASFTNNLTNVQILDDISSQFGVGGTPTTFNLTANSIPFQAVSDRALMVILGGVIQAPGVDYTINGSQITFTTAPLSGLTFYARNIYGLNALNGVNDGIVGPPGLTTGGPSWDSSGNTTISGNLTVQGATTTIQSTTLDVIDKDIKLASNQSNNAGIDTAGLLWGTTAVKLKFYNNGGTNPGLNIEGTNVGIGVTAPTAKLHVNGDVKANNFIGNISGGGTLDDWLTHTGDTDTKFGFPANDQFSVETGGAQRLLVQSAGIVKIPGILDVPTIRRQVQNGSTLISGGNATNDGANLTMYGSTHSSQANNFEFRNGGSYCLKIDGSGHVMIGTTTKSSQTYADQLTLANSGTHCGMTIRSATGGIGSIYFADGTSSSLEYRGYVEYHHTTSGVSDYLKIGTAAAHKLTIDTTGHITPGTVNSQDLGSPTAEFRNLYLGDSGRLYVGSGQEASLYHNGNNTYFKGGANAGLMSIEGQGNVELFAYSKVLLRVNAGENAVICNNNNSVDLYYDASVYTTPKLKTSRVGVTVHGEVAASLDYPTTHSTLDLNFAAVKKLDPRITYSRSGSASYIDEFGIVKCVAANTPRFDHDPVTRESKGLLIEEKRTNYQPYSEEISQANSSNVSITNNNAISPDGTQNASKIVGSGSDSKTNINWGTQTVASGEFTTWSLFVKSEETSCILQFHTNTYVGGSSRVNVELADGTTGGDAVSSTWRWTVTKYPNKWWRVTWGGNGAGAAGGMHINVVPSKTSARDATSGSAVNKTYYAWGIQEEHGANQKWASSYIRTNGQKVTRGADQVTISGSEFTDFYNDLEGTFAVTHSILSDVPDGRNCYVFEVSDGGSSHIAFRYNDVNSSFSNKPAFHSVYNNGLSASMNASGTYTRGAIVKGAMTAKASSFKATWNGEDIQTDGSGSFFGPGSTGQLQIGRYNPVAGYELNGHIQRMIYWPKQLSSTQLVNLTS